MSLSTSNTSKRGKVLPPTLPPAHKSLPIVMASTFNLTDARVHRKAQCPRLYAGLIKAKVAEMDGLDAGVEGETIDEIVGDLRGDIAG